VAPKGRKLVIVESPAKAKTINRYLGDDYIVKASMGHVRDLPTKTIGVDIEHGFAPTYELLASRTKVIAELRKHAKSAPEIFLATDLDREGEAIAWHLAECLGIRGQKVHRVIFNEITRAAIGQAFANPRQVDMDMVNAQQARRVLDRIVGYEVSPLLWRKVAPGLSAGRVQTVAVRLIVEREREIEAFMPEEYWKIGAVFTPDIQAAGQLAQQWRGFLAQRDKRGAAPSCDAQQEFLAKHNAFRAELVKWKGERFATGTSEAAIATAKALGLAVERVQTTEDPEAKGPARHIVTIFGSVSAGGPALAVSDLSARQSPSRPPAPLITSSLQQAASTRLRFGAQRTMRVAQQLYEGVEIPGRGQIGLITYMRTDSRHLSGDAIAQVRKFIGEQFGPSYLPEEPNFYSSGQRAQEAHEAVRPTDVTLLPRDVRGALSEEQYRLYELIWRQFVACQMPPAVWNVTEATIAARTPEPAPLGGEGLFKAIGRSLAFDGFLRVMGMPAGGEQVLPALRVGQAVAPAEIDPSQHFTQPPPRYTEAALVKALEADGIGRPSTYAAIIQTIQARKYVLITDRTFRPTDIGKVVTDKLVKHFPRVFDVRFTAEMEDQLDQVEENHQDWVKVLEDFYGPFHGNLERAAEEMVHAKAESQPSQYTCPDCGKPMVYRLSKTGRYLACTGYPDCKTTHPVDESGKKVTVSHTDIACPDCGKPLTLRKGRFGPFLSCSGYPDCKGVVKVDKKGGVKLPSAPPLLIDTPCPKCGAQLNMRRSARGPWLSCSKYPKCRGRLGFKALTPEQQKDLELQLLNHEKANPVATLRKLDGTPVREGELPAATGGGNDSGNGGDTSNGGDSGEPPPDEPGTE
jgi:DNA topoisomerase-1